MSALNADARNLRGQAYIEQLSKDALRQVRVTHDGRLPYVTVDLRNQANAEASATREYQGRYLFELLQNANDAIVAVKDNPEWSKSGPYRVRIELTDSALIVANDGVPFFERDVDSIYCWGESSKDPNKSIGYKGIGFKSVLEITDSPEIFSQIVQFRFDRETCYRAVREIVGTGTELRLPITRFVFPHTLDQIQPTSDAELGLRLLGEEGFATVIRLPLKVDPGKVLDHIEGDDGDLDPVLLLFLGGIDEINVWVGGRCRRVLRRRVRQPNDGHLGRDITLYEGQRRVSRWLLFDAPKREVDDRTIIDELGDKAWERVKRVGFAVAFRLDKHGKLRVEVDEPTRLFVYFPTALSTGLRYRIHGDFYIDAARKQVGDRVYNRWLARQIGAFIRSTAVPELLDRFPDDERVVQTLVPCAEVGDFAAFLQDTIFRELRDCAFVPAANGTYRRPDRIMLAPSGASVDVVAFHRFFPPVRLSRLHNHCQFPLPDVERDARTSEFLARLGAQRLAFEDVFRLFDGRDLAGEEKNYPALYHFLWQWREQLDVAARGHFSSALGRSHCVVVDDGSWIRPHDRLYHAKLRQETPTMPQAIRADVVHPLAYDHDGRAGPTHRLLSTLQPPIRDYDAPDIIINAVIPLFGEGRFQRLSLQERTEVYQYLFGYWQARRGAGDPDVERVKGLVQVPARLITNQRRDEWRLASEVYLSGVWSGDDRLERLYEGFISVAFLYQVRGLDIPPEERGTWAQFWTWLGVASAPRLLVDQVSASKLEWNRWSRIRRNYPHSGTGLWLDYLQQVENEFSRCPRHGPRYRQLRRSVALEGFAELIESRDGKRLVILYSLLAENWPRLKREGLQAAEVHCRRKDCPQYARSQPVPSFFGFLLRNTEWIPALTAGDGAPQLRLYKPSQCWFVPPAENPTIRNLIPAPPADLHQPEYRQFCRDIGVRFVDEAQLDDWVDILRHLPDHYPDPNIAILSGRRSATRAITTLSRWVVERMNNLLASSGTDDRPQLDGGIPLVAQEGGVLRYVYPPEPVFFADDQYHATRWREHLPFASLDKNWGDAAQYLGIHPISKCIEESCVPGHVLETESNRLENRFKAARPYMLAVVYDQRESETEDVARYLSNLEVRVVDSLVVHRRLTIPPEKILADDEARVYLEETTGPRAGSAGRASRTGTLYVRKGFEENYDLLAGPIAEFVRIPGLADAFVILLDRGGKDGRMRYLRTRGLSEQHVQEMRDVLAHLGVWVEPEPDVEEGPALNRHLLNQLEKDVQRQPPQPETAPAPQPPSQAGAVAPAGGERPAQAPVQLPPLGLSQVRLIFVDLEGAALPAESSEPGHGGGGGGKRDWEQDQRLREMHGEQGERLVKMLELDRLRGLGFDHPEEVVRWLREQGDETADHDLDSKDLVDGKWVDIVIEVKATPARDFRFHMSRQELRCAQRVRDRYRLYRVINVASASPEVYAFKNPYTLWREGRALIEPRDTYVTLPDPRKMNKDEQV